MKNKSYWKKFLEGFPSMELRDWLEVLPVYNKYGDAITCCNPVVQFKAEDGPMLSEALAAYDHQFIDSTVWYVPGYHYPHNYVVRAIGFIIPQEK